MPYIGTSPSNGVRRVHTYTATASQDTFTGASSEGVTLSYVDTNYIDVFQNGVLLGSADYTSTSGTSVVLAQGASADDLIVIVVYDVFSVADTVSKTNGGSFDSGVTMSSTLDVTGNQTNSGTLSVTGAISGTDMELLHTTTVTSNVGQVVIDGHFTSAFKNYKVIGSNVHLDTDNRNLNLKFMSGGSLLTGSVHRSSMLKLQSNASSSLEGLVEATDTEFAKCLGQNIGNATGEHTNFEITLYDPLATDNFKAFSARANNMSDIERMILSHTEGFYNNGQSALSGIEIVPSSGNIASGVFKLYGLR